MVKAADVICGVLQVGVSVVRRLPGGDYALGQASAAERVLVRAVADYLRSLDTAATEAAMPATMPPVAPAQPAVAQSTAEMMRTVMDRSMYISPDESRAAIHHARLQALVPGEARSRGARMARPIR